MSADSIVPGAAAGSGGGAATLDYDEDVKLTPLTVDFHEPGFVATASAENRLVLDKGVLAKETRHAGPEDPQALNRYSYTSIIRYATRTPPAIKRRSMVEVILRVRAGAVVAAVALG